MFEHHKTAIIAHAEEAFPNECLGVIFNDEYVPLENVSPEPEKSFEMKIEDEQKYIFPGKDKKRADALVHSHPDGPLCPTKEDMEAHLAGELPFVFVGHHEVLGWDYWELGDHLLDFPLEERPFRPGVMDCFDAIRSWYWQEWGVYLPNVARRDEWWEPGEEGEEPENMYEEHFKDWGFVQLTAEEEQNLQVGDVFFYKLHPGNEVVKARTLETHGGVYLGAGKIYHHLPGRLSTANDPAESWGRKASRWVRYTGERPKA